MKIPEISDAELVALEERALTDNANETVLCFWKEQPQVFNHIKLVIDSGICHWTCLGIAALVYLALKPKLESVALKEMMKLEEGVKD